MNADHYKPKLIAKERELTDELARFKENARDARTADVEDPIDSVISSEGAAAALEEGTLATGTLDAVRDALRRIEDGSYGQCIDCGSPIPDARLEAVPWTPYCVEDQEKHDREQHEEGIGGVEAIS